MNKLSSETSPYLLQHADNPVHWFPWGEEALTRAKTENKPILLSVGYSACHWCHVMAHESFEDTATAKLMNELFINIKVDREERPDLDKIYQTAHSLLTNRPGGWPLTVFLSPIDQLPIYAGTYFPATPRHGLPAFSQLLEFISDAYQTRPEDITKQSDSIKAALRDMTQSSSSAETRLNTIPLDIARNQIEQQFDERDGGFSDTPKFPHPCIIERALLHWARSHLSHQKDPRILYTALFTLEKMSSGGLFDHLGGGFYRYSTDEKWMIPHFEKMLYDNGPLLWLCVDAWCITKDIRYFDAAIETADWVTREMQSPGGGYYSSLDADSEGVEGKFYVWTPEQIKKTLAEQDSPVFNRRFGLDKPANFESQWHLHAYKNYQQLAKEFNGEVDELRQQLRVARENLFIQREKRIHPGLDDKILTSWNGLMIRGMAHAGRTLNREDYIDSAYNSALFIKTKLWHEGRFLASHKDGKSHLNAYLDDYAFMLYALLELLQARWDNNIYAWALDIAESMIIQFEDNSNGGLFFTSHDHEQLIQRPKTYNDDAIPSGSGLAVIALTQLGYLSGEQRYLDTAERTLKAAWASINQAPISHCTFVSALDNFLNPPNLLIIRSHAKEHQTCLDLAHNAYLANTLVFTLPAELTPHKSLANKVSGEHTQTYPCTGLTCFSPLIGIDSLKEYIVNNSYRVSE